MLRSAPGAALLHVLMVLTRPPCHLFALRWNCRSHRAPFCPVSRCFPCCKSAPLLMQPLGVSFVLLQAVSVLYSMLTLIFPQPNSISLNRWLSRHEYACRGEQQLVTAPIHNETKANCHTKECTQKCKS